MWRRVAAICMHTYTHKATSSACVPFSTRPRNTSDMSSARALTLPSSDFFNSNTVMESVSTCAMGGGGEKERVKAILFDETTFSVYSLTSMGNSSPWRIFTLSFIFLFWDYGSTLSINTPTFMLCAPYRVLRKSVNYHVFCSEDSHWSFTSIVVDWLPG